MSTADDGSLEQHRPRAYEVAGSDARLLATTPFMIVTIVLIGAVSLLFFLQTVVAFAQASVIRRVLAGDATVANYYVSVSAVAAIVGIVHANRSVSRI